MCLPLVTTHICKSGGGGGGGGIKHTTFVWQHVTGKLAIGLLIHVIWDICVNNQSRGYGVFKLNFRDILDYSMLLITGIRDICVKTSWDTGYLYLL